MPAVFASLYDVLRLQSGLRNAQAGALHAIASHFTLSDANAIVTLPTGTGKTLVAVLAPILLRANRVLVITPSRIIRNQVATEFSSLALPRKLKLLPSSSPHPKVKRVTKRLSDAAAWQSLEPFDVVVATPNVVSPAYSSISSPPEGWFDLIIVDEAHHAPARTWRDLLAAFPTARKILLTATPYRRDRQEVPGSIVYSYPLSRALSDKIYVPIKYIPAEPIEGDRDAGLVSALKRELDLDRKAGLASQVLIRTDSISQAERLVRIYQGEKIRVQVVHSTKLKASTEAIRQLQQGTLDGLLCVDMLSEGFDLPALKIAVLHSPHRSLPATLQFIGRLARPSTPPIGEARVIAIPTSDPSANTAEADLLRLYQRESDWQLLIPGLAAGAMEREVRMRGFFARFRVEGIETITLRALTPSFKGIAYDAQQHQVDLTATPDLRPAGQVVFHALQEDIGCAVWITRVDTRPIWVSTDKLVLTELHLHVAIFDASTNLLLLQSPFPQTSENLKTAVAPLASPIKPNRLDSLLSSNDVRDIFNIGIANLAPRAARLPEYTMYAGKQADGAILASEVPFSTLGHASALIQPAGSASNEVRGASMRSSSVWSSRRGTILDLVDWCHEVGSLIMASAPSSGWSTPAGILTHGGTTRIPRTDPVDITWPAHAFVSHNPPMLESVDGAQTPVLDAQLSVAHDQANADNLVISALIAPATSPLCLFSCFAADRDFFPGAGAVLSSWTVEYEDGLSSIRLPVIDYFKLFPPRILLADGVLVEGRRDYGPQPLSITIPPGLVEPWDWQGTDITREVNSAGAGLLNVQEATARNIIDIWGDDTILLNDHRSREISDLIAISLKPFGTQLGRIGLFHCKSSKTPQPEFRVKDVYEVAGQAVKSQGWTAHTGLFEELARRHQSGRLTILNGSSEQLLALATRSARGFRFQVFIVQPGLSAAQLSANPSDPRLALIASPYQWYQRSSTDLVVITSP